MTCVRFKIRLSEQSDRNKMSSVLFQSFNNTGGNALRNDISGIRNQLAEARKDISLLVKALEQKCPEAAEEFMRMKTQEALATTTNNQNQARNNVITPNRR